MMNHSHDTIQVTAVQSAYRLLTFGAVNPTLSNGRTPRPHAFGRRAKFLPSVVEFAYDLLGYEYHLGNIGYNIPRHAPCGYCEERE